ncbi:DUF3089 domain-containing protein [Chondromyces crocatus]|uniref:DUF3089 domain-containing protein n=1 Tax=Chondromyces crocatus TaxID=52 RepID=A0A0K1EN72_CHOCO|nr:DUF3089 domain-containing protein [Chondromyces crocatus]AKT42067.1 uncharacterized protein CMC5_062900 [Chondromyces crocatus]
MKWSKRARRIALGVVIGILASVTLLVLFIGPLVQSMMTPSTAFAATTPPPPPDYADPATWSALPERVDSADRAPTGATAIDQASAEVDVFYLHPTSYVANQWNGPTDDAALNEATDRVATGIQASAFNGCCAIYAPRYRQANGTAFYNPSADGDQAIALAYDDVRRAFAAFNAKRGPGRPFLLAGHSQGSILGERLLREEIAGKPLRNQLVAAYLIGGRVTVDGLREGAPDIPLCRAADDLHCVVSWTARSPTYAPTSFELSYPDGRERACTNPLSWQLDGAPVPAEKNLGAVFLETDDHAPRPGFADARCDKGTLLVSQVGNTPRDLPSRILDHVMGDGNYHPIEFQIFFMSLRQNAIDRSTAFLAARKRQPQ